MCNRHGIVDIHALHQVRYLRASKQTHEFIFQGEEELRRSSIALTGSATAQLVVYAAGIMPDTTDDMQPTTFKHLFTIGDELIEFLHV